MSINSSPSRPAPDSPSRQLIQELNRLLISDQEQFYSRLDQENEKRESIHRQALSAAADQHERVREGVELERRRLEAQIQAEQGRREAEARQEIEQRRREKAERQLEEKKKELERAAAIEAEQNRLAELDRQGQERKKAAEARQKSAEDERLRRAEEERKAAKERQESAQKAAQISTPAHPASTAASVGLAAPPQNDTAQPKIQKQPDVKSSSGIGAQQAQLEDEHDRYIAIHKRMKDLRKFMADEGKKDKGLKEKMGTMRREMRKSVGQLTEGRGANKQSLSNMLKILKESLNSSGPSVPVSPFLASPPIGASSDASGPALLLYLLNIFSKAIISQWTDEAGVSPKAADPIGVIASHIFAHGDFKWQGSSLIDILLSKLHKTCPVLFGIYGPENTEQGKRRLGWWQDENGWLPRQRHYERMTGLASGFAALSLRNYEKTQLTNPYPDYHYWQAIARISQTPISQITQTHLVILKGMIENYEGKFIGFYGGAAVAALRAVLVTLPMKLPEDAKKGVAVKGLQALVEVLKRDAKLVL